jgi:glutamyl-tRNA synthetase
MPVADDLAPLLPMVVERLPRLDAIGPLLDFVFIDDLKVDAAILVPRRWDMETTTRGLEAAAAVITQLGPIAFESDELEPALRALCEAEGWKAGDLFMAIRVALTGRTATPPLFEVMVAIGYQRTLARLRAARQRLDDGPAQDGGQDVKEGGDAPDT